MPQPPLTLREWLLSRFVRVMRAIEPGVDFSPFIRYGSGPTRPIVSSLGATVDNRRVFDTYRDPETTLTALSNAPYLCAYDDPSRRDMVKVMDGELNEVTLSLTVVGYDGLSTDNQGLGEGLSASSALRARLDALRADVKVAAEAFVDWKGPAEGEDVSAYERSGCAIVLQESEIRIPTDVGYGEISMRYHLTYAENVFFS